MRSQDEEHPFYMTAHMTGCTDVSPTVQPFDCRGDPETVNVIPAAQFLDEYTFFTDPTYPETHLVFIRRKGSNGFEDVTLDCTGTLSGWQPIGTEGVDEMTRVALVRGNLQPQGSCDNGRHVATSKAPFGLVVRGWGSAATGGDYQYAPATYSQCVSYAYPAGAAIAHIDSVEVPVPK